VIDLSTKSLRASTKSLEPNRDYWICPYCQSENSYTAFTCGICGSSRKA